MKLMYVIVAAFTILFFPYQPEAKQRNQVHRNEIIPWEQVNQILPRYSKFSVKDLETGKKFNVQGELEANMPMSNH